VARANGCPWNEKTCTRAVEGGHLEILQWARAQDPPCPWNGSPCKYAAGYGYPEILEWLYVARAPYYTPYGIGDPDCALFMAEYGPTWRAGTYELLAPSQRGGIIKGDPAREHEHPKSDNN